MTPKLTVRQVGEGIWSAMERGPSRVAIAYFPLKFSALKHAVRVAKTKDNGCTVEVLDKDGQIDTAREYAIHADINCFGK